MPTIVLIIIFALILALITYLIAVASGFRTFKKKIQELEIDSPGQPDTPEEDTFRRG